MLKIKPNLQLINKNIKIIRIALQLCIHKTHNQKRPKKVLFMREIMTIDALILSKRIFWRIMRKCKLKKVLLHTKLKTLKIHNPTTVQSTFNKDKIFQTKISNRNWRQTKICQEYRQLKIWQIRNKILNHIKLSRQKIPKLIILIISRKNHQKHIKHQIINN